MKAIHDAIQELDGKIQQYTTARDALLLVCPRSAPASVPFTPFFVERVKKGKNLSPQQRQ